MMDWNWDGGWWGGLVMLAAMILFWGGLIWVVIYAIRGFARPENPRHRISAIEILEERFARGEIDRDEFEERRRVLESKAA